MLEPERRLTDEELADRVEMWRTLLWDGAPSSLVETLARSRNLGLHEMTEPVVAELASRVDGVALLDWLHLARRGEDERVRVEMVRRVNEGHKSGVPSVMVRHEQGYVQVQVRPDLRKADFFALPDGMAAIVAQKLIDAAREAMEWRSRTNNGRRRL